MKIKNYIYLLLAGASVMSSCKKSFLNETPSTGVAASTSIKTESDMNDAVNGMYTAMKSSSFYGRDIPVLGDLMADNTYVFFSNSGRYLTENMFNFSSTNGEAADIWNQGYYTILQANRIINNALVPASSNVNELKGEAYITRALSYLQLVNWFAQPYTVNPTAAGVPLVTNVDYTVAGAFVKPSRNTVAQVYSKIISDLDSAYAIMPATAGTHGVNSNYLSKNAAKAIEARAYLYMGDYKNAQAAAQTVVNSKAWTLVPSTAYVAYWANPSATVGSETIFELNMNLTSSNGTNGLDYIYSQAGYGDILATTDLYNDYSKTDVRRSLIISTTKSGYPALVVNKYSNISNANDRDDIKVIRYAEVLLTLAEAAARNGDEPTALIYLNQLATARDASFVGYVSTGSQLISDILNERRKELAFEGLRYADLTRLNLPINRPSQTYSAASIATVPVGDYRRILPIPLGETNANKNISQNTGY